MGCNNASSDAVTLFEWLTFLVGGGLGAALVLGAERFLDWRKAIKSSKVASSALDLEISNNLALCNEIIKLIESGPSKVHLPRDINTTWVRRYITECIDYSNEDSVRLHSFLDGIVGLEEQIKGIVSSLLLFEATGKAHTSYHVHVARYNRVLNERVKELKSLLITLQEFRKANKMPSDWMEQKRKE